MVNAVCQVYSVFLLQNQEEDGQESNVKRRETVICRPINNKRLKLTERSSSPSNSTD